MIDSGLGEALTHSGLEEDLRQIVWSVGLKGIAIEDAPKVEALILDTLQALADEGIDRATLEASLNTIEFRLREQNTGGFPRGLALMLGALTTWLHGGDPLAPLQFEAPLTAIKERAFSERYFENLIKKMLLDNPHRTTVTTQPDPELAAREREAEELRLAKARAAMDAAACRSRHRRHGRAETAPGDARLARSPGDRADAAPVRPGPEDQDDPRSPRKS